MGDAQTIAVTDVGSTTTKALLLGCHEGQMTFLAESEVPTTVEDPRNDVTIGVLKAISMLELKTGMRLVDQKGEPECSYLTTSSAGGGLQILVLGLTKVITGRLAQLAALGAGGVILRTITIDDGTNTVDKMRLIRELHPDLVLLAGGIDGGDIGGIVHLAELLSLSDPTPKFSQSQKVPLVFCGNVAAREFVASILSEKFELHCVDNICPSLTRENPEPAKREVHRLFMENVMEQAPGYAKLKKWVTRDIIPTPTGVERILELYSTVTGSNILMVDMGGATTDIFTTIKGEFRRTVAANIGMSYSLSNILAQAGIEELTTYLPSGYSSAEVRNYLANKTLNPTYKPLSSAEIDLEQAAATVGISLSWEQHRTLHFKSPVLGIMERIKTHSRFNRNEPVYCYRDRDYFQESDIDEIIGAGGVISHVKRREEALRVLTDGLKPVGITRIAIDRSFKSPHLGVLSKVDTENALRLFQQNCLETVGHVIAPTGSMDPGKVALVVHDRKSDCTLSIKGGECCYLEQGGDLEFQLAGNVSLGSGRISPALNTTLPVLVDCRGRFQHFNGKPLSQSGLSVFQVPLQKLESKVGMFEDTSFEIQQGPFLIERKLPYDGTIFVKHGDDVKPDTLIGENRFGPKRIFLLDLQYHVGYHHQLTKQQIAEGLLVKVGDKLHMGQSLFTVPSGTLGFSHNIESPLRGEIVSIDPHGLIVVREIQDYDGEPVTINIAEQLGIKPGRIWHQLKVQKGDFVEKGQFLVKDRAHPVSSPTSGTVRDIDTKDGTITIQYETHLNQTRAFVTGKVVQADAAKAVTLKYSGYRLLGVIGFGNECFGPLKIMSDIADVGEMDHGRVLVALTAINRSFLERAVKRGVAGIIAPSIDNADWVAFAGSELGVISTGDENVPLVLVLTEGFGNRVLKEHYREFFRKMIGTHASLSGRTQIRAGVSRPVIIIQ